MKNEFMEAKNDFWEGGLKILIILNLLNKLGLESDRMIKIIMQLSRPSLWLSMWIWSQ